MCSGISSTFLWAHLVTSLEKKRSVGLRESSQSAKKTYGWVIPLIEGIIPWKSSHMYIFRVLELWHMAELCCQKCGGLTMFNVWKWWRPKHTKTSNHGDGCPIRDIVASKTCKKKEKLAILDSDPLLLCIFLGTATPHLGSEHHWDVASLTTAKNMRHNGIYRYTIPPNGTFNSL